MPLLFSYGTLQQEDIQLATFGRLLGGHKDLLIGFEASQVPIRDPAIAESIGSSHYDNAAYNGNASSRVGGTVFEVSEDELAAADEYEKIAKYVRIKAPLASGKTTWVYVYYRTAPKPEQDDD